MTARTNTLIRLTDAEGDPIDEDQMHEPHPGSLLLVGGKWGTSWQRHNSDGLWHSTRKRGGAKTWAWISRRPNLFLAYDASPRDKED